MGEADGYLPVIQIWAKAELKRLCFEAANAKDEVEKQACFEALKNEAQKFVAVLTGVEILQDHTCDECLQETVEELEHDAESLVGVIGVARDLFNSVLKSEKLMPEHIDAIKEWISDVNTSVDINESMEADSDSSDPTPN